MKDSITIAGITVAPGEKVSQNVTVTGTDFEFPITIVNGKKDGKVFLATAGIHGYEYPGIQAVVELAQEINPDDISGAVILVQCINTSGFYERQTYVVPADLQRGNLNSLFPGNSEGTLAEKICAFVSDELVAKSDFHVDLHSGDDVENLEPCTIVCAPKGSENNAYAGEITKCLKFKYRMNSGGRTECYNSSSIDKNIPSLLFERGGQGIYTREQVDDDKEDLITVMKYLNIVEGKAEPNKDQLFFKRHEWTESTNKGLFYRFVDVGEDVKEGQKLAEIRDMFGNLVEEINAKFDGHMVICSNTLAVNVGDDLFTYGEIEE